MMTDTPPLEATEAKSRRRVFPRATARPVATKTKVTLCLDADAAQRLGVYAVMVGQERSRVVSDLVRAHLKRFRISDLDRSDLRDSTEDRQTEAA